MATDYLDGYFARRRNEVTRLGILLDPLADKLLTAAAFLSLVEMGRVPAWMVMIILARELAVTGLRNVAAGRGVLIRASSLGKAKMVAQVVAILLFLLAPPYPLLRQPALVALGVVVALTLVSGATTSCASTARSAAAIGRPRARQGRERTVTGVVSRGVPRSMSAVGAADSEEPPIRATIENGTEGEEPGLRPGWL